MKMIWCNGLPEIHALLGGISESEHFISGLGVSVHFIWNRGVYLNLNTSSEIIKAFPHFGFGSQCPLHLSTLSETRGVYMNLNTSFQVWVSVSTSSETGGVYLNLNTSSENIKSFPHFGFGSQCPLHLSTLSETVGGYIWIWTLHLKISSHFLMSGLGLSISDTLSGHFIWKYELILGTSSWSLHLTTTRGGWVYLTTYLGTSSENMNSL